MSDSPPQARTPARRAGGAHADRTDAQARWRAEEVLAAGGAWRERSAAEAPTLPSDPAAVAPPGGAPRGPRPLELDEALPLRTRIRRAVAMPAIAGAAAFGIAVLIAIALTLLQGGTGSEASGGASAGGTGAGSSSDGAGAEAGSTAGDAEPASADSAAGGAGGDATGAALFVHVVGEVVSPGVVEVPAGTRVADAIAAAGGATDDARLASINLARLVVDGEQIVVPDADGATASGGAATADAGAAGSGGDGAVGAAGEAAVSLNTADASTLETLPRIGPALAQRIIDWREANGGFTDVQQLLDVAGIGERTFEGLRDRVTL